MPSFRRPSGLDLLAGGLLRAGVLAATGTVTAVLALAATTAALSLTS